MAWELRYTSAERGPTGRSGFQFVAVSPDLPPDVEHLVAPYMTYRPPPDVPLADLAAFPTAFAYGREGGYSVLVRCRYTGRDYSGRYGNFLGHAVVATDAEMAGVRPIELWGSPVWDLPPGGSPSVVPGGEFAPESLVAWLAAERAHDRLAALLDAVAAALRGGHGRVVLVSRDAGLIARWIAVLSYSLPAALAARMSFTTFTGDPAAASQLVVGTVPCAGTGPCFDLDEPPAPARPGRFARVLAGCWRDADLDGIDAVGELITGDASWDGAAALLALCRGETAEQEEAAALVVRRGAPDWVWPALSAALPELGFELAAALADVAPGIAERCVRLALDDPALRGRLPRIRLRGGLPEEFRAALARVPDLAELAGVLSLAERVGGAARPADVTAAATACARRGKGDIAGALRETPLVWRSTVASGIVSGLEAAAAAVREAMLTPEACAALGDRDWTRTPRTGGLVLSSRADRLAATRGLVELAPPDIEELLAAVWHAPPTVAECRWLVERLLTTVSEPVRDGLIARWLAARPGRGELADLAEIEVRLERAGLASGRLAEWAGGLGRFARRHVESALADREPELATTWRALRRRGA